MGASKGEGGPREDMEKQRTVNIESSLLLVRRGCMLWKESRAQHGAGGCRWAVVGQPTGVSLRR